MNKRESFGSTLKSDLLSDLRSLSEDTGIPISKLLDKAVTLLLNEYNKPIHRDTSRTLGNNGIERDLVEEQ